MKQTCRHCKREFNEPEHKSYCTYLPCRAASARVATRMAKAGFSAEEICEDLGIEYSELKSTLSRVLLENFDA